MLPLRYCCLSGGSCVECQFTQQGGLCRISLEKETANRGVCSARTTATRSSSVEPPHSPGGPGQKPVHPSDRRAPRPEFPIESAPMVGAAPDKDPDAPGGPPPQLRRDAGSRCTTTVCGRKGTACDGRSARGGARFQEGTAHGPARAHQLCAPRHSVDSARRRSRSRRPEAPCTRKIPPTPGASPSRGPASRRGWPSRCRRPRGRGRARAPRTAHAFRRGPAAPPGVTAPQASCIASYTDLDRER
jgi:hypothetical protein